MGSLIVRDARPCDQVAIRAVTTAAYAQYEAILTSHWELYRDNISATLSDFGQAAQIVAESDGQIVGTVLLYPAGAVTQSVDGQMVTKQWPEVRLLAVSPDARGCGIGRTLMQECIHRAREAGAEWLALHSNDAMQAAIRIYTQLGFEPYPELDFHPVPEVTVRGFRLKLSDPAT